jgi:hypothetical protein
VVLSGSLAASATISINTGATLDASARSDATLTLNNGQTLAGGGTVKGNVVIGSGATLAPGSSLGTLLLNSNLTLTGGSKTVVEVNKSSSPSNDLAQVAGSVIYGGTLIITNLGAIPLAAGDSFKLFSATNYSGTFTNLVPVIPGLNLAWDTNSLVSNGVLGVVAAPTPPPVINAASLNAGNFVSSGTNGVRGWTYFVLTATNPAVPLAGWTCVATNVFAADGTFQFTNAVDPAAPDNFYLIQLSP